MSRKNADIKSRSAIRRELEQLAWLLDSSIPIPGTSLRLGVDGLIGLIPGIGDVLGSLLSSYLLLQARRLGVPKSVLIHMGFNIALETVVGIVPIVGDLFDVAWKANQKNLRLMNRYLDDPQHTQTSSRGWVVMLLLGLLLGIIVLIFLFIKLISAIIMIF